MDKKKVQHLLYLLFQLRAFCVCIYMAHQMQVTICVRIKVHLLS